MTFKTSLALIVCVLVATFSTGCGSTELVTVEYDDYYRNAALQAVLSSTAVDEKGEVKDTTMTFTLTLQRQVQAELNVTVPITLVLAGANASTAETATMQAVVNIPEMRAQFVREKVIDAQGNLLPPSNDKSNELFKDDPRILETLRTSPNP